uniref:NADH-ubiquinone oxidoreductase chain 3 n=1 Tax=Sphaerotheriidae sp. HYS-2012 TaxID=1170231 RepID=I6PCM1_9MYRI|nr:NADH dehydrogenase subunit 3 [Sphaerotheriidae sp. HYS-2012]AFH54817.1 NADH dehydrogenase subunit 3 [Sphaerotheriidae sp. HYS-2012]
MLMFTMSILTLLFMIIASLSFLLSKKMKRSREKSSPFECGFHPLSTSRIPFSLQFFLIAMIFLIFDVEIVLLLPLPLIMQFSSQMSLLLSSLIFLLILLFGLMHEWKYGALKWAI